MSQCGTYSCGDNVVGSCHSRCDLPCTTYTPITKRTSSQPPVFNKEKLLVELENIGLDLMKKAECRPCDIDGKKDGNFNYIHQVYVGEAIAKLRTLISKG